MTQPQLDTLLPELAEVLTRNPAMSSAQYVVQLPGQQGMYHVTLTPPGVTPPQEQLAAVTSELITTKGLTASQQAVIDQINAALQAVNETVDGVTTAYREQAMRMSARIHELDLYLNESVAAIKDEARGIRQQVDESIATVRDETRSTWQQLGGDYKEAIKAGDEYVVEILTGLIGAVKTHVDGEMVAIRDHTRESLWRSQDLQSGLLKTMQDWIGNIEKSVAATVQQLHLQAGTSEGMQAKISDMEESMSKVRQELHLQLTQARESLIASSKDTRDALEERADSVQRRLTILDSQMTTLFQNDLAMPDLLIFARETSQEISALKISTGADHEHLVDQGVELDRQQEKVTDFTKRLVEVEALAKMADFQVRTLQAGLIDERVARDLAENHVGELTQTLDKASALVQAARQVALNMLAATGGDTALMSTQVQELVKAVEQYDGK